MASRFEDSIPGLMAALDAHPSVDVVVGVTGSDRGAPRPEVIDTILAGVERLGVAGRAIVATAHRDGDGAEADDRVVRLPLAGGLHGGGWQARGLLEAAASRGAALLLLPADLDPQPQGGDEPGAGFSPRWIERMLAPVAGGRFGVALGKFDRGPFSNPVESHLALPVLASVFGWWIPQSVSGVAALSPEVVRGCVGEPDVWPAHVGRDGFDPWLCVFALTHGFALCEARLGLPSRQRPLERAKATFREVAHVLFREVARHERTWLDRDDVVERPAVAGAGFDVDPGPMHLDRVQLERRFRLEFNHFHDTLYPHVLDDDLSRRIEASIDEEGDVAISPGEWGDLLRRFMFAYRFDDHFEHDDVVDALFPFFLGRVLGHAADVDRAATAVKKSSGRRSFAVVYREAERLIEAETEGFIAGSADFRRDWRNRTREVSPYLPRLGSWEFVPNVGVMVPQELERPDGESVWAYQIYKEILDRNRGEYTRFATETLGVEDPVDSGRVVEAVEDFMYDLERAIRRHVIAPDVGDLGGMQREVGTLCARFAVNDAFHLTAEAAEEILLQAPPSQLITQRRARNIHGLLKELEPLDALATAAWTDQQDYLNRVLDILESRLERDWFTSSPVAAVAVDRSLLPAGAEGNGSAALARLAGRVVVASQPAGVGGEFPRLWLLLRTIKSIVGVEIFSHLWDRLDRERSDFRGRLVASIRGHWGRNVLSAHNFFENRHQRVLVERLHGYAEELARDEPGAAAGRILAAALDVYHLSITLPDATFVPLSAWTWASYSNRGGVGTPTPLSSLVERDWATRDFFALYLERAGLASGEDIDRAVNRLIAEGRESEGLRAHILGVSADADTLVVRQATEAAPPPAKKLERPLDRPLLEPTANAWESRYVLNAAAVRVDGTIYILYRAFGDDEISRVGMAWTRDGVRIDGRLGEPVFAPGNETEAAGVEDPRTVVIDGRLYMLYTAWDRKVAQIAMASIPVEAFLERRWDRWERHGLAFPGLANKDAVLYPERIGGRYVVHHRIDPNMWVSYLDDLSCPWPREPQKIFAGPRPGMMWDGVKIGAGGQPIKTTKGWLNIYHGVDYERSYRLGVLFMPLDDPERILYRSPNPILEPETDFEVGGAGSWVPHVVFTCGTVPAEDKDVIGPEDDVLVYYGAADTAIGVARGRLRDIVPTIDEL
jgi:predicted GH43/DUF377 family glycosyl hydrolase